MTTAPSADTVSGRLRSALGRVPLDLLVLTVATPLVIGVSVGGGNEYTAMRALVGLPFVLGFPGYALVSAAFPGRPTGSLADPRETSGYSPGTAERVALAFPCSLALLPPLAVLHGLLGIAFTPVVVAGSVGALVCALSAVALVRRFELSSSDRYSPPSVTRTGARARDWVTAGTATDTALSGALAFAVLIAIASVAVGVTAPTTDASYTSVSLMTETEDGELVASNYTTNVTAGSSTNLTLGIENQYDSTARYETVAELQRVSGRDDGSVTVVERERIGTFEARIPAGETWTRNHRVEPSTTGTGLRLIYYVYRGDVPSTPSVSTAHRTVHLWMTVR